MKKRKTILTVCGVAAAACMIAGISFMVASAVTGDRINDIVFLSLFCAAGGTGTVMARYVPMKDETLRARFFKTGIIITAVILIFVIMSIFTEGELCVVLESAALALGLIGIAGVQIYEKRKSRK